MFCLKYKVMINYTREQFSMFLHNILAHEKDIDIEISLAESM